MKFKFTILLFIVALFCSSNLLALDRQYRGAVENLISCVKNNDMQALSRLVDYPLRREYPLPSIKTPAEFVERYNEVFDQTFINSIVSSDIDQDWAEMGWRGIMLNSGLLWLDYDGKLIAVNYQSEVERRNRAELIRKDKTGLYSGLRDFAEPVLDWKTKNYRIRIDDLGGDNYRYAVWPVNKGTNEKPDLIIENGVVTYEGSGGNHSYEFKNGIYKYRLKVVVIGEEQSPRVNSKFIRMKSSFYRKRLLKRRTVDYERGH